MSNVEVVSNRIAASNQAAVNALLHFLISQYKATGGTKSETVAMFMASRIEMLGGEVPAFCVGDKKFHAIITMVHAAIALVPHLNSKIDRAFGSVISGALSDVYKLATGEKMLGALIADLATAPDDLAKEQLLNAAPIPVDTFIDLMLAIVPLAFFRNPTGRLWMEDPRTPHGRPLQNLKKDLERLAALASHLSMGDRIAFNQALDTARLAISVRTASPLLRERKSKADVHPSQREMSQLVCERWDEQMIGRRNNAYVLSLLPKVTIVEATVLEESETESGV